MWLCGWLFVRVSLSVSLSLGLEVARTRARCGLAIAHLEHVGSEPREAGEHNKLERRQVNCVEEAHA